MQSPGLEEAVHADLIARCREGDREGYYQIYRLYKRAMFNAAFRITGTTEEAEDVLQEAFIAAFRGLEFYRGDAPIGAWLKRIVVNKAITCLKKKRWERLPEHSGWDVPAEDTEDGEERFPASVQEVKAAIQALPGGYRTVLSLYLLEGYDHAEIAEILGISESTSKSQFNRSKKKLKEILQSRSYETR